MEPIKNLIRFDETSDMIANQGAGEWVSYECVVKMIEERDRRIAQLEDLLLSITQRIKKVREVVARW